MQGLGVIELKLTQPNQYHSSVSYFLVYTTTARKQKTIWGQLVSTEACFRLSIFLMWLALLLGCSMVDFQTKGMKFCDHKVMLETFITMAYSPLFQNQCGCGVIGIIKKSWISYLVPGLSLTFRICLLNYKLYSNLRLSAVATHFVPQINFTWVWIWDLRYFDWC